VQLAISVPQVTRVRRVRKLAAPSSRSASNPRPSLIPSVSNAPVVSTKRLVLLEPAPTTTAFPALPKSSVKLLKSCLTALQVTFATLRLITTLPTLRTRLSLAHSAITALRVLPHLFCAQLVLSRTQLLPSKSLSALCASQANTVTTTRESLKDALLALTALSRLSSPRTAPRVLSSLSSTSLVLTTARCAWVVTTVILLVSVTFSAMASSTSAPSVITALQAQAPSLLLVSPVLSLMKVQLIRRKPLASSLLTA